MNGSNLCVIAALLYGAIQGIPLGLLHTASVYFMEENMSKDVSNGFDDMVVIDLYLRKDAIADGVLVDVSEMAREAGFRYPVALTHSVNELCVKVPDGVIGQDESGRLWDILVMLGHCCRTQGVGGVRFFNVLVRNDNNAARVFKLKAVFHHGDEGEPVVTIMLPHED